MGLLGALNHAVCRRGFIVFFSFINCSESGNSRVDMKLNALYFFLDIDKKKFVTFELSGNNGSLGILHFDRF